MLELIGHVYDAAQNEALWPELASQIASTFDATSAALLGVTERSSCLISHTPNVGDDLARELLAYGQRVLLAPVIQRARQGNGVRSFPAVGRTDFVGPLDFACGAGELGALHGIGAVIPIESTETVVLGIHRSRGQARYSETEKRWAAEFLPHLCRALRLQVRLRRSGMAARAALDRLDRSPTATLVANRDCRILYANPAAEALLDAADGVQSVGGRVVASRRVSSDHLSRLVAVAVGRAASGDFAATAMLPLPRDKGLALTVLVAPLRTAEHNITGSIPAAILFIRDPEGGELASAPLQSLFGLTSSEAAVASALASGKSLDEIAVGHGISPHTARAHIKSVFAKTGTSRQAQLVTLLLRSVAELAPPAAPRFD